MKHKEIWRTAKYLMVSASSGLIELGGYALLSHVIDWGHWISYLIALAASVLWNFTINRRYTFRSSASATSGALKIFLFYLVFTPLSAALEYLLADKWGWNGMLVTMLNMFLNFCLEFPYQRFFIYRNSLDTNALAKAHEKESCK